MSLVRSRLPTLYVSGRVPSRISNYDLGEDRTPVLRYSYQYGRRRKDFYADPVKPEPEETFNRIAVICAIVLCFGAWVAIHLAGA